MNAQGISWDSFVEPTCLKDSHQNTLLGSRDGVQMVRYNK